MKKYWWVDNDDMEYPIYYMTEEDANGKMMTRHNTFKEAKRDAINRYLNDISESRGNLAVIRRLKRKDII